jgi:hypothetical protein
VIIGDYRDLVSEQVVAHIAGAGELISGDKLVIAIQEHLFRRSRINTPSTQKVIIGVGDDIFV